MEFVANYRHPAPRRGEPWVHFAGIYFDSAGSGGSAGKVPEGADDYENTIHWAIFSGKWPWKSMLDQTMDILGNPRDPRNPLNPRNPRIPWISMLNHGYPWLTMDIHGSPWISMVNHGYPWLTMDIHG